MNGAPSGETVLAGLPSLPGLYRQAVALAVPRTIGRAPVASALPSARHRVHGVRIDLAELTRFEQELGSAARDKLPSAYLHTVAFPVAMSVLARPDFPLPLLGMVHLSNEVHQDRQVTASEVLDIVAYSENLRPHAAGTQVDVVTEVDVAGRRVWTGRSVYLARGVRLDASGPRTSDAERPSFTAPRPTALWTLDAGTGRRYAAVSGDWNPIHLSGPTARVLGMRTAIAHGMYLAARMVDQAVAAPTGAMDWRIDFAAPVPLPAVVATSFARTRYDGGERVDVVGWSAERRKLHFTGWVRAE